MKWWLELPDEDRSYRTYQLGYVYVIEFDFPSGPIVKIGQTRSPRNRMRQHAGDAQKFGGQIARYWLSEIHSDYGDTEAALMGRCLNIGRQQYGEYFVDCDFDQVIAMFDPADDFDQWSRENGALALVRTS